MNRVVYFVLGAILFLSHIVLGADSLTVQQMYEDIDYYFETVKKNNPLPYIRYNEAHFDSIREVIKGRCIEPMPAEKFLFHIGLVNKLTEYHTEISGLINRHSNFYVLGDVIFKGGKLYYHNKEILSINNIPADEIYRSTDGLVSWTYLERERQCQLQRIVCLVLNKYGIKSPPYQVKIASEEGIQEIEIKGDYYAIAWPRYFIKEAPYLDTLYHEPVINVRFEPQDSLAVLYYNSSDPENIKEFRRKVNNFFKQVSAQGIKNIFIDVSMNGGGNSLINDHIFTHLQTSSFEVKGQAYATPDGITRLESTYGKLMGKEIMNELKDIAQKGIKEFTQYKEGYQQGYDGQVFVLMGGQTFSAGYDFCEMVKRGKKGVLVGEVAGQRAPCVGTVINFVLPQSKIPFTCGTYAYILEPVITDTEGFLQPDLLYPMDRPLNVDDYKKIIDCNRNNK